MDSRDQDFVNRIRDYRIRGAEAREREQKSLLAEAREMDRLVGSLAALKSLGSGDYQVSVYEGRVSADIDEFPLDYGGKVLALRREDGVSQLHATFVAPNGEFTLRLILHPVAGEAGWTLEKSFRDGDGSDSDHRFRFGSAREAIVSFRQECLAATLHGTMTDPYIPSLGEAEDLAAAREIEAAMESAAQMRARQSELARQKKDEVRRAGMSIQNMWFKVESALSFLRELGYGIGEVKRGMGVVSEGVPSGVAVKVHSGENWACIYVDAVASEPETVQIRAEDSVGRREFRGYYPLAHADEVMAEMRNAVLDEIEAAEAVYVAQPSLDDETTFRLRA